MRGLIFRFVRWWDWEAGWMPPFRLWFRFWGLLEGFVEVLGGEFLFWIW